MKKKPFGKDPGVCGFALQGYAHYHSPLPRQWRLEITCGSPNQLVPCSLRSMSLYRSQLIYRLRQSTPSLWPKISTESTLVRFNRGRKTNFPILDAILSRTTLPWPLILYPHVDGAFRQGEVPPLWFNNCSSFLLSL